MSKNFEFAAGAALEGNEQELRVRPRPYPWSRFLSRSGSLAADTPHRERPLADTPRRNVASALLTTSGLLG